MAHINARAKARIDSGHPWVFRSDIESATGAEPGAIVDVFSGKRFCGRAFYNPRSQITLRMIVRKDVVIDRSFWKEQLHAAIQRRPIATPQNSSRLVFAEADFLPGLIVDRYGDVIVFQTLSLGIDLFKPTLLDLFKELLSPQEIVERNDVATRELEGLPLMREIIFGKLPEPFLVHEGTKEIHVDPLEGHKTGLYLDQQSNHMMAKTISRGRVLDLFCYQGGFALQAAESVEEVIAVDSSASSLSMLQKNAAHNKISNITFVEANVFDHLRTLEKNGERFDTIFLDPPPFAASRRALEGAMRGYKEINLRAMKILRANGTLVTCSCSHHVSEDLFCSMLQEAASDANAAFQVISRQGANSDHPHLLGFPESSYLQCWFLRKVT